MHLICILGLENRLRISSPILGLENRLLELFKPTTTHAKPIIRRFSHSLAERVRREKIISEGISFLQDLVPGCSKVGTS
ncbi:hypothetical protein BUALT_Bualt04G0006300 [Buddleja alternifolia]|uniref:BHLH transcription factor n=1 Tax=Buddleja alternifolia TaxID=168488 RepID=A0AAV6XW65_9LAMI|nr:hypothetical protein BUALT_Bualt04G0006300 [Buddleja alternifolia]